jgi:propionyl-CoA synthetase
LDDDGLEGGPNTEGYVVVKLPLPPGTLPNLWQNTERFKAGYLSKFPGYYLSGDGGYTDTDGYVFITGRIDDVINVAGHRLSTSEMEEIIAGHTGVAECAVFGINDPIKGEMPLALFVANDPEPNNQIEVSMALKELIREQIGGIATLKNALPVARLPKTRSGKILRKTLRKLANGENYNIPSTIDDPHVLEEITEDYKQAQII